MNTVNFNGRKDLYGDFVCTDAYDSLHQSQNSVNELRTSLSGILKWVVN